MKQQQDYQLHVSILHKTFKFIMVTILNNMGKKQ